MRSILKALLLLVVLLHTSNVRAQSGSPQVPFANAVNVFSKIPERYWTAISNGTMTTDVRAYVEAAISEACTASGIAGRVSFPKGTYPLAAALDLQKPPNGVGCDGLQLIGTESGMRLNDGPQFVALNDRVGTANFDALIHARFLTDFSMQGFIINGNNTRGDLMRMEACNRCTLRYNAFTGVKGTPWTLATSNAGTDQITLATSTTQFAIGDRIELLPGHDGGAVPTGTTEETGYWIVAKSGANIQISATLGGSVLDLTSSATNFFVYSGTITYPASAVNEVTNTFTITNHGLTNGQKIEWVTGGTPTQGGKNLYGRAKWVINATANTFQVSSTPGGSVFDFSGVGIDGQQFTLSYAHLRGGANLYLMIEENRFALDDVRGVKMVISDIPDYTPGAYFGANDSKFFRNFSNSCVQIGGVNVISENTLEGSCGYPAQAVIEVGDETDWLHTTVKDNYFEAQPPGPPNWTAISTHGPTNAYANVEGNKIFGPSASQINSQCFRVGTLPQSGAFVSNVCRGTYRCFNSPTLGLLNNGGMNLTTVMRGNGCPDGGIDGLPKPLAYVAGSDAVPAMQIEHPSSQRIVTTGGLHTYSSGFSSGATSLDWREGVFHALEGNANVSSITNGDWIGDFRVLYSGSDADAISNSAVATPWGQSLRLRPREMIGVWTDRNEVERFEFRMGEAAGQINPLTAQAADIAATGIWGGNVNAGLYRVCVYTRVTTAGSGGTMDVDIAWNDGVARTLTVIDNQDLATTSYGRGCVELETNGSSDVTYAATRTGVTGSPQYALRGTVEMLQ